MNVLPNSSASSTPGSAPVPQGQEPNRRPAPGAAGFSRGARLLKHADFERVYREGKKKFASHMTVFYRRRSDAGGARVGFTVGRVLGGAVQRNRIKRRMREAARAHWPALPAAVDVVINPRKSALTAEYAQLAAEVQRAFASIAEQCSPR